MRHALPALVLATAAVAQPPQVQLVGITANIPAFAHRNQTACADTFCTPAGFPVQVGAPYFGGTGWDPGRSGAWISNGPALALIDDTCVYQCPIAPTPTPGAITGLEVVESWNEVWATDSQSNIVRMTRSCPPTVINLCNTGVVSTPARGLSGLAVDEGRQLVFYTVADWATQTTQLRVAPMGAPCAPFHLQPVVAGCTGVPMRPVTGLAVDWGNSVLYLTDGVMTVGWSYVYNPAGPAIAFAPLNCCLPTAIADLWIGLAVRPAPAVPQGPPCANGSCLPCPMVHTLVGDPNLGNGTFGLALTGAPAGSVAFAALSLGSCSSAGAVFPGLCGPLWLNTPLWGTLGPNFPAGAGCATATTFAMPLPAVPAFAGLPVASQCLAFCPGGGTSLSNCLSWVLQGN